MTQPVMRTFESGATRDNADNKLDYEGFLSPRVLELYAQYMHKHRIQPDGNMRDSDNWQKGIPIEAYRKSLLRHTIQAFGVWRGQNVIDDKGVAVTEHDALLAVLFNTMGLLHEITRTMADKNLIVRNK